MEDKIGSPLFLNVSFIIMLITCSSLIISKMSFTCKSISSLPFSHFYLITLIPDKHCVMRRKTAAWKISQ